MARKKMTGICHLCGANGALSFEHVPPAKAYNNYPQLGVSAEEAIELGLGELPTETRKRKFPRGLGSHTLCECCNNVTGARYGAHFVDWCHRGMLLLEKSEGKPTLYYPYQIYPLSVIKQIAAMFFSVNGAEFRENNAELEVFVQNREAHYLSSKYRFFAYYNIEGMRRRWNVAGILNVENATLATGEPVILSEITHPPFGYVMTLDSPSPDRRLYEISYFARYFYNEIADIQLRLTTLPTHLAFPGDYRTILEIHEQALRQGGSTIPIPDHL